MHTTVDANGVNLITGVMVLNDPQVVIGQPGRGGLARIVSTTYGGAIARDNMTGTINSSGTTYTVSIGNSSLNFTLSGSTFTSQQGDGSTLTKTDATTYTMVMRDGTKAVFSTAYIAGLGPAAGVARITSLTLPTGEVDTYYYTGHSWQFVPPLYTVGYRLDAITNNFGYELKYLYQASGSGTATDFFLKQVIGINTAVDYCAPTATSCTGLTVNWPSVTFSGTQFNIATDNVGRQTTYVSNANSTIIRPSGKTITFGGSGTTGTVSNGTGTWTYAKSDSGSTRTMTVTDPNGHTRVVVSNTSTGLISSDTDGLSHMTSYQYDTSGRLTKITRPEGDFITYTYDARGNVTQTVVTGKDGVSTLTTSAGFDATCTAPVKCNKPNWTKDANGAQTDYTYSTTTGQLLTVVRPAGANGLRPETDYTYTNLFAWYKNSAGTIVQAPSSVSLLTKVSRCATLQVCGGTSNAVQAVVGYGATGVANNLLPVSVTRGSGDGVLAASTGYTYDAVGNQLTQADPLGNITRVRYDAARQTVGIVGPDPDGGGPLRNRALRLTYQCDASVKSGCDGLVTLAEQGTVLSQSDADWSGFSVLSQVATTYDGIDRKTVEKASSAGTYIGVSQYSYDAANRPTCSAVRMNPAAVVSLPASACTLGTTGSAGPDRITSLTYDNADRLLKSTSGFGVAPIDDVTYTYGNNNEVLTQKDGRGNLTTIVRDTFNRTYQVQFPTPGNGGVSSTTDYEQYTYDNNGNVTQNRRRDGVVVTTGYDALNLPTSGYNGATYAYDNLGRMTSATVGGQTVSFGYNGLNQQISETGPLGTVSRQFYLDGAKKRLTYADGYFVTYGYDAVDDLTSITDSSGVTLLQASYDNLGRVTGVTRTQGPTESRSYGADLRLSALSYGFTDTAKNVTFNYGFNLAGQATTATPTNSLYSSTLAHAAKSYVSNGQNQYTSASGTGITYDSRGNLSNGGVTSFGYDELNRLTSAGTVTLHYDAAGRLDQVAAASTTRFAYDGGQIVAEFDGAGTLLRRYVPGPGLDNALAWFEGSGTASGTARWLLPNGSGNVVAVGTTGSSTTTLAINTYDEYGQGGAANLGRFQYKGMPWVSEIGLYHVRARAYSPSLGRFMQSDPAGYAAGMNYYAFANNDPTNRSDPLGLDACTLGYDPDCGGGLPDVTVTGKKDPPPQPPPWYEPNVPPPDPPNLVPPFPNYVTDTVNNEPAQGKQPSRACQLAASLGETPDAVNQTADMVGNAVATEDAALKGLENLGPRLAPDLRAGGAVLGQLAGSASAKIVGPAGYVIGGAQVAYNTYQGNYGDAAFGSADIGIEATLSVLGGPLGVGVALAWGGVGGSKAVTRAAAIAVCAAGF